MSPVSRSRKPKKRTRPCDCPSCVPGAEDPTVGEVLDAVAAMAAHPDPLDGELAGATVVSMALATALAVGEEDGTAVAESFVREVAARPGPGGLALLRATGAVAAGVLDPLARAASAAAEAMAAAGIPEPLWADELAVPPQVGECVWLRDRTKRISVLVAPFQRGDRPGHGFVVVADQDDCGAAAQISTVAADRVPTLLQDLRGGALGSKLTSRRVTPWQARWLAEQAMDARAVHDAEDGAAPMDEDEPPYSVLAALLRSRLTGLPLPRPPADAPEPAHGAETVEVDLDELIESVMGPRFRPLAPKRRRADGPAPIYQLKVTLAGPRPPIWRRLLVPADTDLATLHRILQAAFAWEDSHLHVFETPYGDFGRADRELRHEDERPVTLEQVAPEIKGKITYVYDLGDDWTHEILVEKVLDRDPALSYPSCTGGRRAAPPEDCGGPWGYADLVAVLTDPDHPERADRLEWLGLPEDATFEPAAFDPAAVTADLRHFS